MSPNRLALCVALGIVIGNIPILGVSTLICAAIALVFRLSLAAIQIVQAAMAPIQRLRRRLRSRARSGPVRFAEWRDECENAV